MSPARRTNVPWETAKRITRDAQILRMARRESVATSPDAFLGTVTDIEAQSEADWEQQLTLSTWAVVQNQEQTRHRRGKATRTRG